MPDSYEAICKFCNEPVQVTPQTWQLTQGYSRTAGVRRSGKHGGSDVRLRTLLPGWVHDRCLTDAMHGVLGQPSLLEDDGQQRIEDA